MALPQFIYGGNTGIKNPEDLARARALAEALLGPQRPAQNVGEGLAVLGNAIRGRREMNAVNRASSAGAESAQGAIAKALGGAGAFPPAPALGGGSSAPVSAASVPQSASAQAIRDGLIKRGLPEHVADGFLMNFQDESGLNPGINEQNPTVPGSRGGYGLYQLTGPRRKAYEQFAAQQGKPASDTDTQLDFMMTELQGPEKAAYQSIMAAPDSGHAAAAIVDNFLRPAESHRAARAASYLKSRGPVQIASNDPSAGIAQALGGQQAPSTVAAALQLPQQAPAPQPRPDIASALSAPPQPGVTPGAPAAVTPAGQRVVQQMVNPQSMTGGAPMPMMGQPPQAQPAPPPEQVAQAQNLDQIPVEAGGNAGAIKQGQLPRMQQLMEASQNPWLSEQQRGIVNMLMKQQMDQADPNNQLDAEYKRAQIDKLRAPDPVKPTGDMQEYEFAKSQGFPGSFVDFQLAQKKAGASSVNVDTKGETEYDKALGKNLADKTVGIMDAGQAATNKIATYQQMMDVLPSVYTGAGGDSLLTAKRALKGLGIDTGDLSGQEFVQAMGNQMSLELRNPAGGAGMPGAMSDSDRAFLSAMSPGLTKTPEGNRKLLEYRTTLEKRNIEVAQQAGEYMQAHNGRLDNGFFTDLAKWSAANPLFPKEEKKPTVIDGYTIEPVE